MPEIGSKPMVASINPMPPATMPLSHPRRSGQATKVMPSSDSMKNSGEPKERTNGRTIGMATASATPANMAPTRELISTAPSARPASPFRAMAWPSTMVDAVVGSPGTPNKNGGDIAGRRCDRSHSEQKCEGLHRGHLENEGQHQGHGRRSAEAGQNADDEADRRCRSSSG